MPENCLLLFSTGLWLNTIHCLTEVHIQTAHAANTWRGQSLKLAPNDIFESCSCKSSHGLNVVRTMQAIQWLDIYQLL